MSKEYNCKGYCLNLQQLPILGRIEPGERTSSNTKGYYCSLTDKRCVGAKRGAFTFSNDKLDTNLIEKCPVEKQLMRF